MTVKYEDIKRANDAIRATDIKGKEYAEVNQRIKAFRMVYPVGFIRTRFHSLENGVCTMIAEVGFMDENGMEIVIGTGTAQEKESSSFINKTSYIENCETSAVGRALGMAGFGIDVSVASAEEVTNAMNNQQKEERKATPKQLEVIREAYGKNVGMILQKHGLEKLEDMGIETASSYIKKIKEAKR